MLLYILSIEGEVLVAFCFVSLKLGGEGWLLLNNTVVEIEELYSSQDL